MIFLSLVLLQLLQLVGMFVRYWVPELTLEECSDFLQKGFKKSVDQHIEEAFAPYMEMFATGICAAMRAQDWVSLADEVWRSWLEFTGLSVAVPLTDVFWRPRSLAALLQHR